MFYILMAVILLTIDQYSEYLVELYLKPIGSFALIKMFFIYPTQEIQEQHLVYFKINRFF